MREKVILLVEDNPNDEALTLRALKRNRIANEVIVARNGVEALDLLLSSSGTEPRAPLQPAVVLLDLKLPRIDGLEVLQRMRADERTKCTPVVILTSSQEERDILRSYEFGANSYIRKPIEFTKFTELVGHLGLYWLHLNEPAPSAKDP